MRALHLLAISVTLAGAVLLASTTAGFGFVTAERGVSVAVAGDQNAILGLTDRSATGEITGPDDSTTVYEVTDNGAGVTATTLDATVVRAEHRDGRRDGSPPLSASVSGSGPYRIALDCRGSSSFAGHYRVTLRIQDTGTVSVAATRTTDDYVSISCTSDDVSVGDGETSGPIDTDGNVDIGNDATVEGDVDSGGSVSTGDRATVEGDVTSDGSLSTGNDATIEGDVDSGGSVSTGDRATLEGDIDSGGSVQTGNDATVEGDIDSDGGVTLGDRTTVEGRVDSGGSVTVGTEGTIEGDVSANGDLTLGDRATVTGDVDVDGTLYLDCGATVEGEVDAANVVRTC